MSVDDVSSSLLDGNANGQKKAVGGLQVTVAGFYSPGSSSFCLQISDDRTGTDHRVEWTVANLSGSEILAGKIDIGKGSPFLFAINPLVVSCFVVLKCANLRNGPT